MLNSLFIGNQDGGIISTIRQAPQSDEPVVIIGLGGTGVDAITRLKTKLYRQIEPTNKEQVEKEGAEPQYNHIKFLGIDADREWLAKSGLTQGERLNIQNYDYKTIFAEDRIDALKRQKELQWMSVDYVSRHLPPHPNGAGAYRQFGRWLTVASASKIRQKLTEVITKACTGKTGGSLIVHIISSISGGMGSGSFADVCYIARDVIDGMGFNAANVFGYFVLPDAIISKEGIIGDPVRTAANQSNGVAALLEIEHLMNLKDSNEWFEQDYGSFQIRTQNKLVNMCHFVSATNMQGVPVSNGYEYSLNVIGDYILAFISREQVADKSEAITMTGNLANIEGQLKNIPPEHQRGYSQNYHIIGSANAEIPTTQMATYLASELFKKLTIHKTMPDDIQIEQEFVNYLKLSNNYIKQLENQIAQGAGWEQISEQLVRKYADQIRAHMNDDILPAGLVNPTENSLRKRKGLLIQKRESMEKKVDSYAYQAGASSIPGIALNKLIEIAENPDEGPIYAYGMMNKNGADIFHYLDGRLKYYSAQKQNARDQEAEFTNREPIAKRDLGTANPINRGRRIREYASILNSIYYWKAQGDLYEQMEILMSDLNATFREMNNVYLRPLYDITNELIDTFQANSNYFQMGKGNQSQDGFTRQLVKFSHIKPELDGEIKKLDSKAETCGLLQILTYYPEIWMEHDERKLKGRISAYILNKFNPILSGSLESFLRKELNMQTANTDAFVNALQNQIIAPLVDDAAPVFWTNEPLVGDNTKTAHRSVLTVPSVANCVCQAAVNQKQIGVEIRKSLIDDRIYILRTISGVPMHAYLGLTQYLGAYTRSTDLGLHLYERDVNWREILTFPYPYSYVPEYTKNADALLQLYANAEERGIIYYVGNNAYVKRIKDVDPEQLGLDTVKVDGEIDETMAKQKIAELNELLQSTEEPLPINSKGNGPGNVLVKDNFLRFYGVQQTVKEEISKYDHLNETIVEIEKAIEEERKKTALRKAFFDGIVAGIFDDDGFNISYTYVQFGMQKTVLLCSNGMPFSGLSKYYQAFKNMCDLEAAVQSDIMQNANEKFDQMSPKDKLERLEKLLSSYNAQVLAMISNNYQGKLEQKEIDDFYASFVNYLDQIRMILSIAGTV